MKKGLTVTALASAVGLIVAIVVAAIAVEDRYVTEPELLPLIQQVQANTEASLLQQLENAFKRGDQQAIRRLCNVVQKLYRYKPSGCP